MNDPTRDPELDRSPFVWMDDVLTPWRQQDSILTHVSAEDTPMPPAQDVHIETTEHRNPATGRIERRVVATHPAARAARHEALDQTRNPAPEQYLTYDQWQRFAERLMRPERHNRAFPPIIPGGVIIHTPGEPNATPAE